VYDGRDFSQKMYKIKENEEEDGRNGTVFISTINEYRICACISRT
jgi:hypothetical protein